MRCFLLTFSVRIAWRLAEADESPTPIPKKKRATVVSKMVEQIVTKARASMPMKEPICTVRLQPKDSTNLPATAIERQEPRPKTKIIEPSTFSPILSLAFK